MAIRAIGENRKYCRVVTDSTLSRNLFLRILIADCAIDCYVAVVIVRFSLFLLAFAVLVGSPHAASWSHDHFDGVDHALVLAQTESHDGDPGMIAGQESPSDTTDVKGDVVGHHSHAFGIAAADVAYGFGGAGRSMITANTPARLLTSFSQAPPTQPPSA